MIDISNISKSFGSKQVLIQTSLKVAKGETLVIIGRSGCGKSVLLKHVMRLLTPDQGKIFVDQLDIFAMEPQQLNQYRMQVGMLFQNSALFDSMTVYENVSFSLHEHYKLPEAEIQKRVVEKLKLVGLSGIENLMPSELSGGMKKRVALARAICTDPKIVLYDEPTTGLDPIMSDAINELIIRMQDRLGITSIVVTHDMNSAYKVANRIAMLYEGRIVYIGTPEEIRKTDNAVVRQFISGSSKGPIAPDVSYQYLIDNHSHPRSDE
ncbi:MAG: ABC transporter ATP-binding protein [Candidatus Omnitrophica bacterium CG11_big_fil_rev_8_21_14_0_20_45_26]|uniref:ABC transporter ATP-binding protein n=1 Tax=Candidatus Abzuiibacterium crystallinum TaxID=1974748 RepID=A0A2H0LL25_9BACT|nr:MAG: ABC transporter ATP-binding protein [Candidatus Omnitrophica bacterium CG11_big_fil_rev_8_21_14_0_20_45_26]PIW63778.1 MAG: ABC transporter ATP-binding protein [Candidatus Omnitrophica bacterium CG12_big_fil_rev_8_21_14_0_65_45_16]